MSFRAPRIGCYHNFCNVPHKHRGVDLQAWYQSVVSMASNRLKYRSGLGSGSAKFIFSGLPPVQACGCLIFAGLVPVKSKNTLN